MMVKFFYFFWFSESVGLIGGSCLDCGPKACKRLRCGIPRE